QSARGWTGMTKRIVIAALAVAIAAACGGNGGSSSNPPPEPPAEDASSAELEQFVDDYNRWLESCGNLNACAEQVENDPRYEQFNEDFESPDVTECRPGLDIGC